MIWNEFNSSTSETFKSLLLDEEFVDVTLVCDDARQFHAHKVILSACSPFFRNLFVKNPHPKPLLFLKGIRYEELETILKFMYLGQAQLPQDDLSAFLAAAKDLQVKGLNCNGDENDEVGRNHPSNNKRKRDTTVDDHEAFVLPTTLGQDTSIDTEVDGEEDKEDEDKDCGDTDDDDFNIS